MPGSLLRRSLLLAAVLPLLAQGGRLRVMVTDPHGALVRDAEVIVTLAGGETKNRRTDSTGTALFEALPDGNCRISAAAPGFQVWQLEHTVRGSEEKRVDARLVLVRKDVAVDVKKESLGHRFKNWLTSCTRR